MIKKKNLGYLQALISILINVTLFSLKMWAGMRTASIAIIADAWHTLSDSFSSVILLLGFKIANKPPDRQHPFGHGRAELIAAVIIGTILILIGFNFLLEAVNRFRANLSADFDLTAKIVTLIAIASKAALARFAFWATGKTDSELIRADGWHHLSDSFTSILILAGIYLNKQIWWIDNLLGVLMSLILFYAAYGILKKSVSNLLGEGPDKNTEENIKQLIREEFDNLISYHHLHCHNYGHHKEITFHITLPARMKLEETHRIANNLENKIRQKLKLEATIHVDPGNLDKSLFERLL